MTGDGSSTTSNANSMVARSISSSEDRPARGSTAGVCHPKDDRNRLLFEFIRFVEYWRPSHVVFENVTGLWFRGQVVLREALARIAALGYNVDCQVLHAEAFGVPQRRRRLIVQASLDTLPVWPMPWRQTADPAYRRLQTQHAPQAAPAPFTVDEALGDLPLDTVNEPTDLAPMSAAPRSDLARWMRGLIPLGALVPTQPLVAPNEQTALFAA